MEVGETEESGNTSTTGGSGLNAPTAAAQEERSVVLEEEAGNKSGRHVALHPLALVTICDHCTRVKVGGSLLPVTSRILGILFGVQNGLQVSITDAFELQYEITENGSVKIPAGYVIEKKELFGAVNQGAEVMGWYSVGEHVLPGDLEIHRAMTEWNESPFFLLLSPAASPGGDEGGAAPGVKEGELPARVFETELHMMRGVPSMLFVPVPFRLTAAEAERISVEHVVKAAPLEAASWVDLHVDVVKSSLSALVARVKAILRLLQAVKNGQAPPDRRLLRMVRALCDRLPAAGPSGDFKDALTGDYQDSLVITYLASITKLSSFSSEVSDKFGAAFGEASTGGGGLGGYKGPAGARGRR